MDSKAHWIRWRAQCQTQIDEHEKELTEYRDGLRISQWRAGKKPTDTTDQRIGECNRLIALYSGIVKRIDEDHLA